MKKFIYTLFMVAFLLTGCATTREQNPDDFDALGVVERLSFLDSTWAKFGLAAIGVGVAIKVLSSKKKKGPGPSAPNTGIDGHRASFLLDDANTRVMNLLSPQMNSKRAKTIQRLLANGDNSIYLYLSNDRDGPAVNLYRVPFSSSKWGRPSVLDAAAVEGAKTHVSNLVGMGLPPIFWMLADDSKSISQKPLEDLKAYFTSMVGHFDTQAMGYVVALEANEHLTLQKTRALIAHLKTLTTKPVGIHLTSNAPEVWMKAGDILFHQYGFGKSPAQIFAHTQQVIRLVNPIQVVAAEYHKSSDTAKARALGDQALRAGAIGTGNGANQ